MNTRQSVPRFILGLFAIVLIGCTENKSSPSPVTTLARATQELSLESEQLLNNAETEILPDADIKRVPISVTVAEAKILNETVYRANQTELDSIESRLRNLLEKEIDVTGTQVLYSTSVSSFNRVPYLSRTVMEAPPRSARRVFKFCYQEGRVRCVFKIENGSEQLCHRVFYDDAGAPAVICEHVFGNPTPNAVHYLQYDDRGYLARYLEFWADEKTGLRHRASYVVQANNGYENATTYWFSETGDFREKYTHTSNVVYEQTHRDDQAKRASGTPFQVCINHPLQYGMKTVLPIPNN